MRPIYARQAAQALSVVNADTCELVANTMSNLVGSKENEHGFNLGYIANKMELTQTGNSDNAQGVTIVNDLASVVPSYLPHRFRALAYS